jgi:transcriptional regulator of acetoin/glycerol metabolism
VESELFGHEKGSFTGAVSQRKGKFELADGGTLFLDEIADMNLKTQAKILRVLEDKQVVRLGGKEVIHTDVRLISATNKDLNLEIEQGRFRADLYYRIKVVEIHLPPLMERQATSCCWQTIFCSDRSIAIDCRAGFRSGCAGAVAAVFRRAMYDNCRMWWNRRRYWRRGRGSRQPNCRMKSGQRG